MPFVLLGVAIVFLVTGVRGTQDDLIALLKDDFTGKDNFFVFFAAILFIGALGYIEDIKPLSDAFLLLVIVTIIISNKGLFNKFQTQFAALKSGVGS